MKCTVAGTLILRYLEPIADHATYVGRLLAFFHEVTHIRLNRDAGEVLQDSEPGVEDLVNYFAENDLREFLQKQRNGVYREVPKA